MTRLWPVYVLLEGAVDCSCLSLTVHVRLTNAQINRKVQKRKSKDVCRFTQDLEETPDSSP